MMGQFLDHPLTINLAFGCMMQNVKANESAQQILMFHMST
jgi:hypothetical protein